MADQPIVTPQTTDPAGTVQPTGTVPGPSAISTPATAGDQTVQDQTAQQPGDNSNKPDAQTPAAKSIPANLVNNPQVESQKLATQADANKNSPSPFHTMLRHAAIEMLGGPQVRTEYKPDGTAVRTPVEPSLAHLGLALAATVLKGGLAGGNAKDSVAAAQQGAAVADKQRAAVKQANIDQDAQAKADQNHKLAVVKNNLETHQLALNVGKQDLDMNNAFVKSYEDTANMVEQNPEMIKGDVPEDQVQEGLKTGKYNVTKDIFIPHGDPVAVMDPQTGKQKEVNGVPVWGHNYYVVDAKAKGQLTQEIQDMGYKIGKFRGPDGERINVPTESQYPMATIGRYATEYAQIQTAEEQIERHKEGVLGDKAGPRASMADSVASDPSMMQAVKDYSRFIGAGAPDQVLGAMMSAGKGQSAAKLMDFMGVTPDDVRDAENQRLKEATEAKTVAKPLTPEAKNEINAKIDLLKAEKETQGTIQSKNREDVEKMKSETGKLDAETDKLLADKQGEADLTDAIGTGHVSASRMDYIISRKPEILEKVLAKYPDFDTAKAGQYGTTYKDFTSGPASKAINAGGTAFRHMNELRALNTVASRIPGTKDYQRYENKVDTVADELAKFYGNSTIPGIEGYKKTLNATFNRDAAITEQGKSMGDKMDEYANTWKNAAPSKAYEAPMPGYSAVAAQARAAILRPINAKAAPTATPNAPKNFTFSGTEYPLDAQGNFTYNGEKYTPSADGKTATKVK
jgi:hypothetical protein